MEPRRSKESQPVLAICYDFDKTLSPNDMQAQGYIQAVGYDVEKFWQDATKLANDNAMDSNLAYMYMMVKEAQGYIIPNRQALQQYGARIQLFPGVEQWFSRIRQYGAQQGVIVEHYIISSGLKEMIEGTPVANQFEKIYASSFYFNERGVARQKSCNGVNFGCFDHFLKAHLRQNGRQALCKHAFAGTGRADEQHVVPAACGNL